MVYYIAVRRNEKKEAVSFITEIKKYKNDKNKILVTEYLYGKIPEYHFDKPTNRIGYLKVCAIYNIKDIEYIEGELNIKG